MKITLFTILCAVLSACGGGGNKTVVDGTGDVTYKVTFNASWSSTTHPDNFPSGAHFSGLIGATHNINTVFWEEGGVATTGIEQMSETGGTSGLAAEVNANISLGDSKLVILGSGLSSPGSASVTFPVSVSHPYFTLVTMVAPSPDWFTGVHGFNLMPNGSWLEKEIIPVYAYDAGTDSGSFYTAGNFNTSPQELITQIITTPFLVNSNIVPVGEFVIEKM